MIGTTVTAMSRRWNCGGTVALATFHDRTEELWLESVAALCSPSSPARRRF